MRLSTSGFRRGVQVAFVALFATAVLLPFVGMLWAPTVQTTENRTLAELPGLFVSSESGSTKDDGALAGDVDEADAQNASGEAGDSPSPSQEATLNVNFLSELGAYFEDHFAYRNDVVAANAYLRSAVFRVSASESVVVGANGWLYYAGTLADYQKTEVLSDRALDNIAFNLSLMQGYCQAFGSNFVFAAAPDKNSLYAQNMPYYITSADPSAPDSLAALIPYLQKYGVTSADLSQLFANQNNLANASHAQSALTPLYYLRDSHWNTLGAAFASAGVMQAAGDTAVSNGATDLADLAQKTYEAIVGGDALPLQVTSADNYIGDLNAMLYPAWQIPELDYTFTTYQNFDYIEGSDPADAWIQTKSSARGEKNNTGGEGEGTQESTGIQDAQSAGAASAADAADSVATQASTLLMFRDSFANNMLQFFASTYENAYFSKYVPYDLTQLARLEPSTVVVERAQRHISDLAKDPAIMPAPTYSIDALLTKAATLTDQIMLQKGKNGTFTTIAGELLKGDWSADAQIYVRVTSGDTTQTYVPFRISSDTSDYAFKLFIQGDLSDSATYDVIVVNDSSVQIYKAA